MRRMILFVMLGVGTALGADPTISVTAQQRYPWNGLVDVAFTITGDSGAKYDTSFTAKDVVGCSNLTMKTLLDDSGKTLALTNALAIGSYRWAWNAAADLPDGFVSKRVTIDGLVIRNYPQDSGDGTTFVPGQYLILNLSNYTVETKDAVTSASTFNADTYKKTKMVFRRVPAGCFMMQQNGDSKPVVKVTCIKDYYISIFECTFAQYRRIGGDGTYDLTTPAYASWDTIAGNSGVISKFNTKIQSTGYVASLPSEAQWERAARAGSSTARYYNSIGGSLGNYAWYSGNASWTIQNVGLKLPNAWGLYDMYGNSLEWCLDRYADWSVSSSLQPGGPTASSYTSRVMRGGGYCYAESYCSSVKRSGSDPAGGGEAMGNHDCGFRVVLMAK